jgi:hypothetical protein
MIRAQVLDGSWQILGRDILPGIEPREVLPSWGEHGPESLGFTLYRSPSRVHAELRPFTPVEWYPGDRADGSPLWSGYTMQAPPGGDSGVTNVTCQGWHYYREDRPASALYVHDDLAGFVDARSLLTEDLAYNTSAGRVETGDGQIMLGWENGTALTAGQKRAAVVLDLGPGNLAERVYVEYEAITGFTDAAFAIMLQLADVPYNAGVPAGMYEGPAAVTHFGAGGTISYTASTPRRYVQLIATHTGTATLAHDLWYRITRVLVASDTAYESGGESVFTADQGIKHARNALCPLLSADDSRIATVTFPIRHSAWLREDSTMRQRVEAWNAYHGYREGVDAERRVFFQPQPSTPRLQVDASDFGVEYVATSTNDGTEIYNAVSVRGRSGSGEDLRIDRALPYYIDDRDLPLSDLSVLNGTLDVNATGWTNATRTTTTPKDGAGALSVASGYGVGDMTGGGTFTANRFYRVAGYMLTGGGPGLRPSPLNLKLGTTTDYVETSVLVASAGIIAGYMPWSVVWQPSADTTAANVKISVGFGQHDTITLMDATGSAGIIGARLRVRSFTLNVSAATDLEAMDALAQAWLLAHRSVPHKASLTVSGDAVTDLVAGRTVPADELGRYYGEMIRVLSVPDPDTGALLSRDGVIASVQGYSPASLALDSERRSLEAMMSRMGVVQGSA